MIPRDPAEREAMAAEYVLGTLEAGEAAEVAHALVMDPALRDAVAEWTARLAPLSVLAPPAAPPEELWARIEYSLSVTTASAAPLRPMSPAARSGRFWKLWASGATAVAAGFAALMLLGPLEQPHLTTVLLTSAEQPAWLVEARNGGLQLAGLNRRPVEAGRVQQLWALPPGATAPVSLGLVPEASGRISVAPGRVRPEPGMLIEITLEPPGGSPTGRPTGPVLFIGRLTAAGGA